MIKVTTVSYKYPSIGDRMRIIGFDFEFVKGESTNPGIISQMEESVGQVLEVINLYQCNTKVRLSDHCIYNLAWLEPYDTISELNNALMLL